MSNSVASGDASSVSASVTSVTSSPGPGAPMPAVEYSNMSIPAVEPQNPFDTVILEQSQSGSSALTERSGTSALMQTPTRGSATVLTPEHAALINTSGAISSPAAPTPPSLLTPPRTALVVPPGNINNVSTPVQQTPPPPLPPGSGPHPFRTAAASTPQRQGQLPRPPQQQQQQSHMVPVQGHPTTNFSSDTSTATDDTTAPSSASNTAERGMLPHDDDTGDPNQPGNILRHNSNHHGGGHERNRSLTRFMDLTRRRLSRKEGDSDEDELEGGPQQTGALIAGYLQKLGRNGKWQTRWFETDGECLSYYKSSKRTKLLATLDLQKVGLIEIDTDDAKECSFRIQVLGRLYHLRASTRAQCRDWVITLNRVKEARMRQGNVKLVGSSRSLADLLDQNASNSTPRVVVVANRQRTRAVDAEEQWSEMNEMYGVNEMNVDDPYDPAYINQRRHSALSSAVVARWTKRRTSLQRLGAKLSKWARSLKKYSCQELERENVILDQHVHPPGHDDGNNNNNKPKAQGHPVGWFEKEASNATMSSHVTNEREGHATVVPSPLTTKDRSLSSASSDYRGIS